MDRWVDIAYSFWHPGGKNWYQSPLRFENRTWCTDTSGSIPVEQVREAFRTHQVRYVHWAVSHNIERKYVEVSDG